MQWARTSRMWFGLGACLAAVTLAACGGAEASEASVRVAAASSLRDLLESAVERYEAEHAGVDVELTFAASSSLARQIRAGAAFDLFVSADRVTLERIDASVEHESVRPLLANRLALVRRADAQAPPVHDPADLALTTGPIAIASPEVPAGRYARQLLDERGLEELEGRFVLGRSVRATLALVESAAADHGFVYFTDTLAARGLEVAWVEDGGPGASTAPRVEYFGAALVGASDAARELLAWLDGASFLSAARELGFVAVER